MYSRQSRPNLLAFSLASLLGFAIAGTPLLALAEDNLPDFGLPSRRVGGGTRSPCIESPDHQLTAITPVHTLGKTVSEVPTLFVYIPSNTAEGAEIGIADEQGKVIDQIILKQEFAPGVFSFSLSRQPNAELLALNTNYKWHFQLICDFNERTGEDSVEGWIQRVPVSDSLKTQLQRVSANSGVTVYRDRAKIYAQAGLWYNYLENLALARRSAPNNLIVSREWTQLFRDIELANLAGEPLN